MLTDRLCSESSFLLLIFSMTKYTLPPIEAKQYLPTFPIFLNIFIIYDLLVISNFILKYNVEKWVSVTCNQYQ